MFTIKIDKLLGVFDRAEQELSSSSSSKTSDNRILDKIKTVNEELYDQLNKDINSQFIVDKKYGRQSTTLLYFAVEEDRLEIVKELLNRGANVDAVGGYGNTPLSLAIEEGRLEIVKELLEKGADVNAASRNGNTPLTLAARGGHLEVVKELLKKGATVSAIDQSLATAARGGYLEVVRELLNRGANVDAVGGYFNSPQYNIYFGDGYYETQNRVSDRGANADEVDELNGAPLRYAAEYNHLEVVRELLNNGAIANAVGNYKAPLHYAADEDHLEVVKELLNRGADVDAVDEGNNTPLHYAAERDHLEIVKELLNRGADVNAVSEHNHTPLHYAAYAAKRVRLEIVKELLNRGADVNAVSEHNLTPLHCAAERGRLEVVKELLNRGADVNAVDGINNTPLHYAAGRGSLEVVKELLNRGADIDRQNNNGQTSLRCAFGRHRRYVSKILIKYILAKDIDTERPGYLERPRNAYRLDEDQFDEDELDQFDEDGLESEELIRILSRYWDKCRGELELIRTVNIGSIEGQDVSLYDFFTAGDAKSKLYVKEFGNFLNSEEFMENLSEFKDFLVYKFEKCDLYNQVEEQVSFYKEGKPILPKELVDKINQYLNHEDRKTLFSLANGNGEVILNLDGEGEETLPIMSASSQHNDENLEQVSNDAEKELKSFTREPISIFKKIRTEQDEIKKQNLEYSLSELRNSYSNEFRIGAALDKGDCFFDAVAQRLNELNIKPDYRFTAKSLREDCENYAEEYKDQIIQDAVEGGYFVALQGPHGPIQDPQTGMNAVDHEKTFSKYLKGIKAMGVEDNSASIWGRLDIEGKMICKKYNVKIEVIELREEPIEGKYTIMSEQGESDNVIRIVNYRKHYVPLLSNLQEDIEEGQEISSKEVYGEDQSHETQQNKDEELPGPSRRACLPSGRQKREANNDCSYSWEDVDEFNEEKDEPRDSDKIRVNSEKFLNYIENIPEEKRTQLIELASKIEVTGKFKGVINRLINNEGAINHLNKVGKVSGLVMHGMMAKNALGAFLNGDYKGVAINVGFIAGGQGLAKVAEATSVKGLEMVADGKLLLGRSLRLASPFLARGTSAFIVYDLVNQVKALRAGNKDALVGVVGDSVYLGVDVIETGIEIAEVFEVLEGVSSVTGPIGAAIGAVVFVGTDVYLAVKRVDKIDEIIHLTTKERFIEGLRAFVNMKPEQYIQELMEEKQINNQLVKQGLSFLEKHPEIQRYVFPTQKPIINCYPTKWQREICDRTPRLPSGTCVMGTGLYETYEREECKVVGYKTDLDNEILLDRKRTDIKWSRAKPDNPDKGELFCLPAGNDEQVPSDGAYLCENAIGIAANNTGNYTLFRLGEGKDYVQGFIDSPNVFLIDNGLKNLNGGSKDDIFFLQGSLIKGFLYGGEGSNTLDATHFAPNVTNVDIYLHTGDIMHKGYNYNVLKIAGMNRILGRKGKADYIFGACDTEYVDGQGGEDHINILNNDNCSYNMEVIVRPYTNINNYAVDGSFTYIIPAVSKRGASANIIAYNYQQTNHRLVFNYTIYDINNIVIANDTVSFSLIPDVGHLKFESRGMGTEYSTDYEFNITSNAANNTSYQFSDNTEIKVGEKNLYAMQRTNKPVDEIINDYSSIANNLKMSIFVQSNNETVAIGHGNHDVLHNDPEHKSHLVGNGGENIYVMTSGRGRLSIFDNIYIHDVTIYDLDKESSIDTLDLRGIVQQVKKDLPGWSIATEVVQIDDHNSLSLNVKISNPKDLPSPVSLLKVKLKDICVENRYEKLHVILNNAPMKLERVDEYWGLKPLPLVFNESKEIIIVTPKDVEKENRIVVARKAGNYIFGRSNNDLEITNAFDNNLPEELCTIVLKDFYQEKKMETLVIKFADQEIVLKDHQEQVDTARDIEAIKKEQRDRIYNEVFNNTMGENISSEVVSSNETTIRQSSRTRRAIDESEKYAASSSSKLSSSIFSWVKELIGGLLSSKAVLSGRSAVKSQVNGQFAKASVGTTSTTPPSDGTGKKQESNYFTSGKFLRDNIDYVNENLKQAHERQMPDTFKLSGKETTTETMSKMGEYYLSQLDSSTITLLDLVIRKKVKGQRFIPSVGQSISLLDARAIALSIIEEFEQVLNETAVKSGISATNLNFDPVAVQSTIVGKIRNGKFSEVSKTLYESAKEACPEFKQTGKFLMQLKSHLEDILAEKEVVLLTTKQKAEYSKELTSTPRKAIATEKPKTFLNGTSIAIGIGNNLGA